MKVSAKLKNIRIAPRKSKLVADLIKGMDTDEALNQLDSTVKRTSPFLKKLLLSAIANGENNLGLDKTNLYVYDVKVCAGPSLKRWMPKAFGRAGQILKRTSSVEVILEERVEGKGRKSKEEMEKEKKKKAAQKRKEEKAARAEKEEKDEKEKKEDKAVKAKSDKGEKEEKIKDTGKKSWGNKIFRRKSM